MVSGVFSIPLATPRRASRAVQAAHPNARPALPEFIGGEENLLVRAAADSFLARPARFNPLLFVGPTGVGKTHLALGLAERWKNARPGERAIQTTGADFARDYATAVDTDSLDEMRESYLAASLLVVDSLDELLGKRPAQEELARLVDALVSDERCVVACANQIPTAAAGYVEALASRLAGGLSAPLAAPGLAARRLILGRLAEAHGLPIGRSSLDRLAERFAYTVPNLRRVLLELEQGEQEGQETDYEEAVSDLLAFREAEAGPASRAVLTAVAKQFHVKGADLRGQSRRASVVHARGVAMYLSRRLCGLTLEEIGAQFGGRDHTTVLHACRKIERLLETDAETQHAVQDLLDSLSASSVSL